MKSKFWAGVIAVLTALLLTWGYSLQTGDDLHLNPSLKGLLILSVLILGIAGSTAVWIFDWMRGIPVWTSRVWMDYLVYFLINGSFFVSVLWRPQGDSERKIFFFLRLPFFLFLAPIFWLGVLLTVLMRPGRFLLRDRYFRTPLQMWGGLVDWLRGVPSGYRISE